MNSDERQAAIFRRAGGALLLLIATLLICLLTPEARTTEPAVVMSLPYHIGPLLAFSENVSTAELTILPPDTTFARKSYGTPGQSSIERIRCSIVLAGQVPRSLHRPERCLPAQGFTIESSRVVEVPLKSGRTLSANALDLARPVALSNGETIVVKSYFLYWFAAEGVSTPDHFDRVFLTNWDLLAHRVNLRWCYVYVQAYVLDNLRPNGRDAPQTLDLLKSFIRESVPYFMKSEMSPDTATLKAPPARSRPAGSAS